MRLIECYTYDELKPDVQKKVVEKNRDINLEYNWHDFIIQYFCNELYGYGVENVEINYSGFWCQGDGASFTADIDIIKFFDVQPELLKIKHRSAILKVFSENFTFKIVRTTSHYYHNMTVRVEIESNSGYYFCAGGGGPRVEKIYNEIESALRMFKDKYCYKIYNTLEEEYNYLTSDECIIDTIRCNEYEYLADGTPV